MSQDLGGGEGAEAFFVLDEVAGGPQTGGTGEIEAHNVFELAVGSGAARFGGTEQGDERFVHCRSGMHGAGVIGDHQVRAPNPLHHFRQRGLSAKVQAAFRRGPGDDFTKRLVALVAQNDESQVRMLECKQADQFSKIFGGPAFVAPAGAWLQCNPARSAGLTRPLASDIGSDGRPLGQPLERGVEGDAEQGQDGQVPIGGMGVEGVAGHGKVVKTAGAFPDLVEADQFFAIGQPGDDGGAGEALEVDDEVKILFPQPADGAKHFGPMAGPGPAAAFEADDAGEVGIVLEQGHQGGVEPPIDLGGGPVPFQQTQHGQGLDDIA